ncbi:MAG: VOC family protein [Granulosicoccus sp.]
MARLEHANVTVKDPQATAALLENLFGWKIRWQGDSIHEGHTVHVGSDESYLALYAGKVSETDNSRTYDRVNGLNHLGIVVDDLEETERKVVAAGLEPINHADYEPGKRFYFLDEDNLEFEIIEY